MTLKQYTIATKVFGWLLWADIRFIIKDFIPNLIDAITWPACIILVNGWIAPLLGMPENYGAFTTVSMIVIMGAYTAWTSSSVIAADIAGPRTISYDLTLPLPYWLVWLKIGLYLTIKTALFNIAPLFIGKIILGSKFDLTNFSFLKFVTVYLASSLLFGMFALLSTVITKTVESHSRLELRLIGPMFFLNGWIASWAIIYAAIPALAIFMRCLPWIYAYEGCRAAVLGQQGYLNIWMCSGMLVLFACLCAAMSIYLFKRRMDCV